MSSFGELFDELGAEGREIVRIAAGDEPFVDDHFLIGPAPPGILDVGLQGWIGSQFAIRDHVCFHQKPWPVADRAHGLLLLEEGADESHGVIVGTQLVRAYRSAGNDEAIEVVRADVSHRPIDLIAATRIEVAIVRLRLTGLKADDGDRPSSLFDRLLGLDELGLFGPARRD